MKYIFILILWVYFKNIAFCQFSETISSDRPGQTFSATTLGKKVFQIQTGFTYGEEHENERDITLLSNTFLRFALTDNFDIEAMVNWRKDNTLIDDKTTTISEGVSNTQIGFKYNFIENEGWVPALGFQGRVITQLVDSDYKGDKAGMLMNLTTSNMLTSWLSFNMNIGLTFPQKDNIEYYVPATFNFSTGFLEKWGAFIELYGNLNDFNANFDTGFSYLLNNNLMLDCSGGYFKNKFLDSWFVDVGVSYRVVWRE